jgi:mono/diheme cytochrome c family protein
MRLFERNLLFGLSALALIPVITPEAFARGDATRGRAIAERWCASCHLVGPGQSQAASDPPSFASIAQRNPSEIDALAGFLADPHPPMPKLSLSREEIRDLLAYIATLRP